jgi:hypothetical protein
MLVDLIPGKIAEGEGNPMDIDMLIRTIVKTSIEEITEIGMTGTGEIEIGETIDAMIRIVQTEDRRIPMDVKGTEVVTGEVQEEIITSVGRVGTRIDG